MANCERDVPLCTCLPYISSISLQEWVLSPTGLKDDDSSLVIAEQVDELVCKLGSQQLDGQSGIESLKVTHGRVAPEYPRREVSMVGSATCEGSTARHAGIDVELDRVPAILMNDEGAIRGGGEPIKPGYVLSKLRGESEGSFF